MTKKKTQEVPAEVVEKFAALQEQKKTLLKEIKDTENKHRDVAAAYFATQCKELFTQNPNLHVFSWTQYTPHFNDGDTCYFSANTSYPEINESGDGYDDDEDEVLGPAKEYPVLLKSEEKAVRKAVVDFLRQFDEDTLEDWFGDHVEVVVKRKGTEVVVDVNDYDHE